MSEKPTTYQLHELTIRVLDRLLQMKQGELIYWPELSALMGLDAQAEGRHYVDSARRILRNKYHRVYHCVIGEGVKWMTDQEVARQGPGKIRRVRRFTRRWQKEAQTISLKNLDDKDKQAALSQLVRTGFLLSETENWSRPEQKPLVNGANPGIGFPME